MVGAKRSHQLKVYHSNMATRYLNETEKLIAQPISIFRKLNASLKKQIRKEKKRRDTILKLHMEAEQLNAELMELRSDRNHPGNYVTKNAPGPIREGGYMTRI